MGEIKAALESSNEAALDLMMKEAQERLNIQNSEEKIRQLAQNKETSLLPETKLEKTEEVDLAPKTEVEAASEVKEDPKPEKPKEKKETEAKAEGEEFSPEELLNAEPDTETDDGKDVPYDKFKKRVDKLTAQREEAKRAAEERQREIEYWKSKALGADPTKAGSDKISVVPSTVQTPKYDVSKDPNAPKLEQFANSDNPVQDYVVALNDYVSSKKQEFIEQQTKQAARDQKWQDTMATFAVDHPDFTEVFHPNLPVNPYMAEALKSSVKGAEIAYYLGKNPQICKKLASMNPVDAVIEMGRLDERFKGIKPKKVSNAPDPVKKVTSGSPDTGSQKDPNRMTDEEYREWRMKSGSRVVPRLLKRGEK